MEHVDEKVVQRFISKIEKTDTCWIWTGATKSNKGYGTFSFNGRTVQAHRFSFEFFTGKKPHYRKHIDHLCDNPSCVNPSHLKEATHYENIMRSNNVAARSARKKVCDRGHPLSGENLTLRFRRNGRVWRKCKECTRLRQKLYMRRKRERLEQ